jgi:predicted GIY-YIG superfamily endonuclease
MPVSLVYAEDFFKKSEALMREKEIKKLSHSNKQHLVRFGEGRRFPSTQQALKGASRDVSAA